MIVESSEELSEQNEAWAGVLMAKVKLGLGIFGPGPTFEAQDHIWLIPKLAKCLAQDQPALNNVRPEPTHLLNRARLSILVRANQSIK